MSTAYEPFNPGTQMLVIAIPRWTGETWSLNVAAVLVSVITAATIFVELAFVGFS